TIIINVRERIEEWKIRIAAGFIREGKLVAFPTETVYGLGANALDENAVKRIFEAKGRPADNPLIIHIASFEQLEVLAKEIPEEAEMLAKRFWPGPLTLVLPKSEVVPRVITGGLDTVAVRMPAHEIALKLIELSERPIAAPSANISGKPSPTSAHHVAEDFYGKIECIIDGGETRIGVESTVIDLTEWPPVLLRPGGLPLEEIEKVIGEIRIHPAVYGKSVDTAKAPGMKYRHYAPSAEVIVVEGPRDKVRRKIEELIAKFKEEGKKVGVIGSGSYDADEVFYLGDTVEEIARNLFKALRHMDRTGVDVILAEGVEEKGLGLAVMNRLRKASGYRIIKVHHHHHH
uniref:Threonylcarbamoyl-AMP synthase n=1 Tax=Pyrococcus abyssi (strain GE5 / Orsay) TaxID=272844 RepID=UPI000D5032DF|nr:Chain A, Threonylcarbamoyl-AMP synthase [Pyrococcus abyssi GE5]6F87_B Chain B, Threonylcarbamoyl-AMP synthase [Pyrococcus abyssi GE5]6F87_C Chain C, Threonylcarbamoyl-AMP synthase [Pyrococcus abyssi GE5]6F87_D Chain D, Threonylcarbamoyl-AMP synthase [Pyrococcus abyssi GE5]6F8Y_A Chain A, Threonylcarbamoyl-AMP synthase [Pyrococcus abyssi GE5]6F8Y_B Chain B, Threonylcarbamoyl-AMP synthase [Pyrococcus abyssi GE5]6F8Y_C Chain C, Threonylcarbamoyl-AMP synthase [Pyrococcus abyssi GE5]6F8Y_D Cha